MAFGSELRRTALEPISMSRVSNLTPGPLNNKHINALSVLLTVKVLQIGKTESAFCFHF